MDKKLKILLAAASLLVAVVWLAFRLGAIPVGGPRRPSVRASEEGTGQPVAQVSVEVSPGVLSELKPGEIAFKNKQGETIVLARPPASRDRARLSGLPLEHSAATPMIQYLLHGPSAHGYTQADAEWFLAILREHEDSEAKKIGLWGMGFALGNDPPDVPPRTYDAATKAAMEQAILESLSSKDAVVRRSAASQAFIAKLDQRPEYAARLKELTHDPDPDIAQWVTRRLERAEQDRVK